jgi:hypothetical protein
MHHARLWLAGALGAVLVLATPGMTSSAAAAKNDQAFSVYAPSMVVLTIANGEESEPVQRAVMLRCTPAGGDHPAAADACDALEAAAGDFTAITKGASYCAKDFRPVTVTARGVWQGALVDKRATFSNACVLTRATGQVFGF